VGADRPFGALVPGAGWTRPRRRGRGVLLVPTETFAGPVPSPPYRRARDHQYELQHRRPAEVDHPRDALECFGSGPIDVLAMGPSSYAGASGRHVDRRSLRRRRAHHRAARARAAAGLTGGDRAAVARSGHPRGWCSSTTTSK
jgi:hypothetical protein